MHVLHTKRRLARRNPLTEREREREREFHSIWGINNLSTACCRHGDAFNKLIITIYNYHALTLDSCVHAGYALCFLTFCEELSGKHGSTLPSQPRGTSGLSAPGGATDPGC